MKTLIRIEHIESGIGFFIHRNDEGNHFVCGSYENKHSTMPNRRQEFGKVIPYDSELKKYFCSYKSVKIFKKYCSSQEFKTLYSMNFRVYRLKVRIWYSGAEQSIFKKENILSKEDISHKFLKSTSYDDIY